jgi:hypothetical protein
LHRRHDAALTQGPVILEHDGPREGTYKVRYHPSTGYDVERVEQPLARQLLKPTPGYGRVGTLAHVLFQQFLVALAKLSQTTVLHCPTLKAIPGLGSSVQRSQRRKIRRTLHKLAAQMSQ